MKLFFRFCTAAKKEYKTPKVAMFSAQSYDIKYFQKTNNNLPIQTRLNIDYFSEELNEKTAPLTKGYDTIIPFINDKLNSNTINTLAQNGIDLIALRCVGFNNVDLKAAEKQNIKVVRVPSYSPYAVAEHTAALLLSLIRKIHKAHNRTKEGNFSLDGLLGFNLHQKTVGILGAGKIGKCFMAICKGLGMNILYNDVDPQPELLEKYGAKYVDIQTLFSSADVISLHCPLNFQTQYIIDSKTLDIMKKGAIIINTGRGKLMRADQVITALKNGKLGGVGLDVYEHADSIFYRDVSGNLIEDDTLALLLMYPNVIVTGHQAYFTKESIKDISEKTIQNIIQVKSGGDCPNFLKDI